MSDFIRANSELNPSILTFNHLPIFRLNANKLEFLWVCTGARNILCYTWSRRAAPLNASRQFMSSLSPLDEDTLNKEFSVVLKYFYGESAEFKNLKFQIFSTRRECMIMSDYNPINPVLLETTICCLWSGLLTLFRPKTNISLNYNTKDFIPAFTSLSGLSDLGIKDKIQELCENYSFNITIADTDIRVRLIEPYILDKNLNGIVDASESSCIYSINLTDAKNILFFGTTNEKELYDIHRLSPAMTLFLIREVLPDLDISESFYPVSVSNNKQLLRYTLSPESKSKITLDTLFLLSGASEYGVLTPPSLPVAGTPLSYSLAEFKGELFKTFLGGEET